MPMSRRYTLIASAAALAAPGLLRHRPAQAQPAAPTVQAPGFYRFKVGNATITQVNDGFIRFRMDGFMTNAPLADVQAVLREHFMPTDAITVPFTVTFVQLGNTLVVFDAGNGVTAPNDSRGGMIAKMAMAGIDPARVTHVVHSHFHPDHVNGLLNAEGGRAFPNADIIVPAPEWSWWSDDSNSTRSPERQRANFANSARRFAPYQGRVRQIQPGGEVLPGITSIAAPGHTPGHTAYRVADGAEQFLFLGDLTNRPELMVTRPDWQPIIDFDGELAVLSRRRVLDMAATDRLRVGGYHFPFPANGYIARQGDGFRFVPAEWSSTV
jgi:glyoxylase-like metal-dependent hydrolase (beta-lactamase superfamily II)